MRFCKKIAIHLKDEIRCYEFFDSFIDIKENYIKVVDELGDETIYPLMNVKFIFIKNSKIPKEIG